MKKKNGFTLAEVLVTLGIIGIIAALTLPGLSTNTNRRSVGPALSKAIHNLEAANKALIQEEGVRTLDQIDANYLDLLERKLDGQIDTILYSGSETEAFIGKDRNSYIVTSQVTNAVSSNSNQGGKYWSVIIDVNGRKNPNQGGTDQFLVYVDNKGQVLSAGSKAASQYVSGESEEIDCHSGTIDNRCTGTIERDGWEAKY